jgi:hypothetical protein
MAIFGESQSVEAAVLVMIYRFAFLALLLHFPFLHGGPTY